MKVGLMVGEGSGAAPELKGLIERGQMAERFGLDTAWIANIALDAMTACAALGGATSQIEIGTAVVPTFTRHPVAMAQQSASTQMACEGRFTLGIGLAHKFMVEDMWGLSYDKPAQQMRAYLEILEPALRGVAVTHQNENYDVKLMAMPDGTDTSVLVAALGPLMLKIAGRLSGGTITMATGLKTLETHIVPTITAGAEEAGRPPPRIVAGFPVLLTANKAEAHDLIAKVFEVYAGVPSYRAMLDREGVSGVEDVALVGEEVELNAQLERLESIGVTDLLVMPVETAPGEMERTIEFLAQR